MFLNFYGFSSYRGGNATHKRKAVTELIGESVNTGEYEYVPLGYSLAPGPRMMHVVSKCRRADSMKTTIKDSKGRSITPGIYGYWAISRRKGV